MVFIWCQLPDLKKIKINLDQTAHVCDIQSAIKNANPNRLNLVDAVDIEVYDNQGLIDSDTPIACIKQDQLLTISYPLYSKVPFLNSNDSIDSLDHIDHSNLMNVWKDHDFKMTDKLQSLEENEFIDSVLVFGQESLFKESSQSSDDESVQFKSDNYDQEEIESADFDIESSVDASGSDDSSVIYLGETHPTNDRQDKVTNKSIILDLDAESDSSNDSKSSQSDLHLKQMSASGLKEKNYLVSLQQENHGFIHYTQKKLTMTPSKRFDSIKSPGFSIFSKAQRKNYRNMYKNRSEKFIDRMLIEAWNMLPDREKHGFDFAASKLRKKSNRRSRIK